MRVFISHQLADALPARRIADRLAGVHGISSYLDVIDPHIAKPGEDLADHIREQLGGCSHLIAVVSESTRASQWVPWEVGVASEKELPLATYAAGRSAPPEFLRKWPYLRSDADLDRYAWAARRAEAGFVRNRSVLTESLARRGATRDFYSDLRSSLGQ